MRNESLESVKELTKTVIDVLYFQGGEVSFGNDEYILNGYMEDGIIKIEIEELL